MIHAMRRMEHKGHLWWAKWYAICSCGFMTEYTRTEASSARRYRDHVRVRTTIEK